MPRKKMAAATTRIDGRRTVHVFTPKIAKIGAWAHAFTAPT
jgi:hypothetical protein